MEGFFDKSGDLADLSGADDEIDKGVFLLDFFGAELSHASGDSDDDIGSALLDDVKVTEKGECFVFRFSADAAGVEKNNLGLSPGLCRF